MDQGQLRSLYGRLATEREPFLRRGRDCSRITIPFLLPEESESKNRGYMPEPYQSIGARGVNNLASRLLLSLFPVNEKFFRLMVEPAMEVELDAQGILGEVDDSLADVEDLIQDEVEASGLRIKLHQALRQIVVTGNALLHFPAGKAPRVFRLDSYVVERDPRGHVIRIGTRQRIAHNALPEALVGKVPEKGNAMEDSSHEVITVVERKIRGTKAHWEERQEIDGKEYAPMVRHEANRLPYIPLRMYAIDGESYGRGIVEEYLGDLRTLEGLVASVHDCAMASGRLLMLVDPDGVTRISKLATAENGDFVPGRVEDVQALQLNKYADLRTSSDEITRLERRLGLAFLLNSTVQRQAERVTAEEIRLVAQELEDTLGGTFSLLSADLQLPLVNVILGRLRDEGVIPKLPDAIRPVVVTGLDAIGRGHDLQRLDQFIAGMVQLTGPESLQYINMPVLLKERAKSLGIEVEGLIKTPEEIEAERQQAMMQEGMMKLGPKAMEQFPEETAKAFAAASGAAS